MAIMRMPKRLDYETAESKAALVKARAAGKAIDRSGLRVPSEDFEIAHTEIEKEERTLTEIEEMENSRLNLIKIVARLGIKVKDYRAEFSSPEGTIDRLLDELKIQITDLLLNSKKGILPEKPGKPSSLKDLIKKLADFQVAKNNLDVIYSVEKIFLEVETIIGLELRDIRIEMGNGDEDDINSPLDLAYAKMPPRDVDFAIKISENRVFVIEHLAKDIIQAYKEKLAKIENSEGRK